MTFYFCNTFGNTSTDGIYRIDLGRNDSRETLAAPLKNLEWACIAPNGILYAVGQEESGGSYIQFGRSSRIYKRRRICGGDSSSFAFT